jgi:hypothetical protein
MERKRAALFIFTDEHPISFFRFLERIHSFFSSPIGKEMKSSGATGVGIEARGLYQESALGSEAGVPISL